MTPQLRYISDTYSRSPGMLGGHGGSTSVPLDQFLSAGHRAEKMASRRQMRLACGRTTLLHPNFLPVLPMDRTI